MLHAGFGLWHGRVSSPLDDAVYDCDFLPCWKDDELVGHSSRENLLQLELLSKPPELYWSLGENKLAKKAHVGFSETAARQRNARYAVKTIVPSPRHSCPLTTNTYSRRSTP